MVLKYKFEFLSNGDTYVFILNNIISKKQTIYKIDRDENFIYLYIEDSEENLLKISDEISQELPLSIFLKDFVLEVVPQMPQVNYHITPDSVQASYCSNCLAEIENIKTTNYYNPFINCLVCGTTSNTKSLSIKDKNKEYNFDSFKQSFEFLASLLAQEKTIKIKNSKMQFTIKKFTKLEKENQKLICLDLDKLNNLVVGSKQKTMLLQSIEKPSVDFNINAMYKVNTNVDFEKINVSYPWDLVLYLLAKELKDLNINFLTFSDESDFDYEVEYENSIIPPKVSITKNKIFLLENSTYNKRFDQLYKKFDEASKSQFLVLIDENNLYEKSIVNIFFSSKYDDAVSLYSPKIDGVIDIVKYKIPKTYNELFEKISKSENGDKLLDNYKTKFPEIFEKLNDKDIEFSTNSMNSLWKVAANILSVSDIYDLASKSLLQKGPRIDYKVKQSEKLFNKEFDFVSLIKSGMSFKLAGVDEKTLAFGYVENYLYFLSDLLDTIQEEFKLDGISFAGDLVAEEFINNLSDKIFSKQLKLYYNKDFPIQL